MTEWTNSQIVGARAIELIKHNMTPLCEECGTEADRPKCMYEMGGFCPRHEQEDLHAFNETIRKIEDQSDLKNQWGWKVEMPLYLLHEFSQDEIDLLKDLEDSGGTIRARKLHNDYSILNRKNAVSRGSQYDKEYVNMTPRGQDLLRHIRAGNKDVRPDPLPVERGWTDRQVTGARAIMLIKHNMEPHCEECGVGLDNRPNCPNGSDGDCQGFQSEARDTFEEVIELIEKHSDLDQIYPKWYQQMPLWMLHDFSETEINLLKDLRDAGGRMESRNRDDRFSSLSRKRAVNFGHQYKWHVSMQYRGQELLDYMESEGVT